MEPLHPIREGTVTRIDDAPPPKGTKPFPAVVLGGHEVAAAPPPEVLDALDRAARVLHELGRKNVTVALDGANGGPLRVMLHHPGSPSRELSHNALLNLLDGDTSVAAP
jgi:hypothetical protein